MTENTTQHSNAMNKDAKGRYASVNGLKMYYEIHGEGFPLVMLHGAFATIDMFGALLPQLSSIRQIIAVEQQGHGHTADIDRELRFEYMADDTAAFLAQLGIEQTDVFGYSLGGSVALHLALRHPDLVRKLALASTGYDIDGYYPEIREGLLHASPDGFPPVIREAYERVAPNPKGWPALVAKLAKQAASPGGLRPEDVQAIKAPALVLIADGDIIRPEHAKELSHLLHTDLVVIPNSDHASYIEEHPDVLLAQLRAFLDGPLSPADEPEGKENESERGISMKMERRDQGESNLPIELGQPARRALVGAGYLRLEQLTEMSEDEIKQLHGIGPKAIRLLRRALETLGLSFADKKERKDSM